MEPTLETAGKSTIKCAVFNVGDMRCGIDTAAVREINRNLAITGVHLAPEHVRGVINLRGEIVNVIDVRLILGMEPARIGESTRIVVVRAGGEDTGLLVDSVDDIDESCSTRQEPPPPNISNEVGRYLSGVYRTEKELVAVLDVEQILRQKDVS